MERRNFLKHTALATVGLSTVPLLSKAASDSKTKSDSLRQYTPVQPQIAVPRGAIYIPAQAYNTWQQWKEYDNKVTERDFAYAASIGLNSLRIWLSYEYWLEIRSAMKPAWNKCWRPQIKKDLKYCLPYLTPAGLIIRRPHVAIKTPRPP